ncbi:phosphodiester glycosidase family protein [Pleurocapsales cyanobacterium LEGE 06147]|nr:phosphodiester glycosidase family protein [Pleurocapsales cyanobacterium LEGE 06147]
MKKALWLDLILISLAVGLSSGSYPESIGDLPGERQQKQAQQIDYQIVERSQSTIHAIIIPHNSNYSVIAAVSPELKSIDNFASQHQAVAAINGGYFDPKNEKTTSYITQQGKLVADPRTNERLIDNPALKPYLGKILNRTEFRRYICGKTTRYDLTLHDAPIPSDCQLLDALGGGPSLLPKDTFVEEGFVAYSNGEIIRDAIGSQGLNARSAVGITRDGDIVLAMVAQKPESPGNSGMSLPELAEFLSTLNVEKAMNLDGGSSSSIFYQEQTFYGKVDAKGNQIQRPIKSALLVLENKE